MPNHVTCRLTAPKEVIDSLGPDEVDFEKVIPMPEVMKTEASLHVEDWARVAVGDIELVQFFSRRHEHPADTFKRGDYGGAAAALRQSNVFRLITEGPFPKDFSDADFEALIKQMRALRQYGHANWYDWSIKNWGTKWNAYQTSRVSDTVVTFKTAWSAPLKVILKLSEMNPEAEIRIEWSDEDFGNNVGDVTFLAGDVKGGDAIPNGTPAAFTLAYDLHYNNVLPEDAVSFDPATGIKWRDDEV